MSAITRFAFRSSLERQSTLDTVAWWESRRPMFNVAVGTAGLLTLSALRIATWVMGGAESGFVPWQPIVAYGVIANVCYTLGWPIELALRQWLGDNAAPAGAALFRYGFVFSVGLTILPGAVATLVSVVALGARLLGV